MITLFSPAKINLFLRILGKRLDGYHELASLFQAIDLGDTITFSLSKEDALTCSDSTLPCDHTNLISKAVHLFRRKTGLYFSVNIHLEKKIPTQAGLGGGSSNAATTLWALNALHHFPYSDDELQIWSSEIGSDIPFFFSLGTAYCTGRGELVRNMPLVSFPEPLFLFKPMEGISTPSVYQALLLHKCSKEDPEQLLMRCYSKQPTFLNDLEEPAFRILPILEQYKNALLAQGSSTVAMSGSGTCLFGFGTHLPKSKPVVRTPNKWFTSLEVGAEVAS